MEYFYGGGGNNNPSFPYAFIVKSIPDVMWAWCERYPLTGPFERWHVKHDYKKLSYKGGEIKVPLIQFESKKAAYLFRIAYSEYIIENKSIYELDNIW
jgi:hypothetical protein